MRESKCSDEVGRKTSNQLGVSSSGYTGLDVSGYQSQIREGGALYVLAPSLLHDVHCSQYFAGWYLGGELLFFSFPEIHCCCSWSFVSFIENLIVSAVSAHFVTAV
jgi:hypothetical protein